MRSEDADPGRRVGRSSTGHALPRPMTARVARPTPQRRQGGNTQARTCCPRRWRVERPAIAVSGLPLRRLRSASRKALSAGSELVVTAAVCVMATSRVAGTPAATRRARSTEARRSVSDPAGRELCREVVQVRRQSRRDRDPSERARCFVPFISSGTRHGFGPRVSRADRSRRCRPTRSTAHPDTRRSHSHENA